VSLFLCFTKARTSLADTPHSVALVSTANLAPAIPKVLRDASALVRTDGTFEK